MMDRFESAEARMLAEREAPVVDKPTAPVAVGQGASCGMCSPGSPTQGGAAAWLAKHRGWVLLGGAGVAGTGLALGQGWVTMAALAPLLYAAPCAIMMMFCMKGMMGGGQTTQNPASTPVAPPAGNSLEKQV